MNYKVEQGPGRENSPLAALRAFAMAKQYRNRIYIEQKNNIAMRY
jgi:hypothetical protein